MLALKSSSQNSLSKEEFCNFYLALASLFHQEKPEFFLERPFRGHTLILKVHRGTYLQPEHSSMHWHLNLGIDAAYSPA